MSHVRIEKALMEDRSLSSTAKLVLAQLTDRRNKDTGKCNPSRQTLADDIGTNLHRIKRALRELYKAGWIESTQERHTNSYRIKVAHNAPPKNLGGASTRREVAHNAPPGPPYPYMNLPKEPIHTPAAANTCRNAAAAAPKPAQTPKPKPPASEGAEAARFRIVRDSLYGLAEAAHIAYPDDDLVHRVLAVAPAAAGHEISATLVRMWKDGRLTKMRGWGFVLLKLGDCVRRGVA